MPDKLRTIIESHRFRNERASVTSNVRAMDDALDGVLWVLARDPTLGRPTDEPGIYAIPTGDYPAMPAMVLYYAYDNDTVLLLSLTLANTDPDRWR